MPRPKIDPKLRKRSVRACVPCKLSKLRCDSQQPCSRCSSKGRASSCVYSESSTHGQQRPRTQSQSQPQHANSSSAGPNGPADNASANAQSPPVANQSRMLLNSKGEKVYIGHTASLSYLGFVRHVVKTSMGPSSFTENEFNNFMLEIEPSATNVAPASLASLDIEQKRLLIESYTEASSGILDLFSQEEITEFVSSNRFPLHNEVLFPRRARALNAAFKLAISIGIQCKNSDVCHPEDAASIFAEGQKYAFEGMLCDVSLDAVRIFLLMTFYMLGACQRNAAFMYLGIAAKAASALGLFFDGKDQGRILEGGEAVVREKLWRSLCVLDTIVSAILGRYGSIPWIPQDEPPSEGTSPGGTQIAPTAVDAAYRMCVLIDGLETEIRRGGNITSSSAESFLYEVRHCSQKLPPEMRSLTQDKSMVASDHEARKKSLGALHVACAYYFAVILATRPFFTSHLMLKLKDQGFSLLDDKLSFSGEERLKIANLGQVCLDAAKFMTSMLVQALEQGLLLDNMCLIKAWVLGSGLLLGFSLFVEENGPIDLEQAFNGALSVLFHLSHRSPQAKHYHEILLHLWEAILEHRKKRADDKRRMTSQFLYPMFPGLTPLQDEEEDRQTYPSPLSTEQLDNELASNFNMDEVLSTGLDVDLSAAFSTSKDLGEEYWQPFAWGLDGG